jgi:hypothetical protein
LRLCVRLPNVDLVVVLMRTWGAANIFIMDREDTPAAATSSLRACRRALKSSSIDCDQTHDQIDVT